MDEFRDDPKITRLPVRGPVLEHASAAAVRTEVEELLAEAEPETAPEPRPAPRLPDPAPPVVVLVPDTPKGPPPHHRNGRICPQCDRWTWQATRECVHCDYDLFAHEQRLVQERQRQWHAHRQRQLLRWAMGLIGGGLAAIYFAPSLPSALRPTLAAGGVIALFAGYVCGKMLD